MMYIISHAPAQVWVHAATVPGTSDNSYSVQDID
jgi:hypothetical protein